MIRSIFGKLLLSHLVVILVSVLTLGLLMSFLLSNHLIENRRVDLLSKGNAAMDIIAPIVASGRLPSERLMTGMGKFTGGSVWLMDKNGKVIAGQPPEGWSERRLGRISQLWETADWQEGSGAQRVLKPRTRRDPSIVAALPLPHNPTDTPAALFLYAPVNGVTRAAVAIEELLLYSLLAGGLVAAIVGFFVARNFTRPLADISRAAAAFAQGEYNSRTTATNNDEIGKLGQTFNSMAEELARSEQNRQEFLSDISHEVKTPVASIQALAETMLDGLADTTEQRNRYLNNIVSESERIGRLVSDLLDLSQLEAGELSIVRQKLDLRQFTSAYIGKLYPFAEAKSLEIEVTIPETIPPVVADYDRLGQVFLNLLTNAIRHADAQSAVTINAHLLNEEYVTVEITNQGPGIPTEHLPRIWQRFYRVDKSRSRSDGGTGLGLAITKKLVEAMGGNVNVASTAHLTTFSFTVPTVH